MYEVYMQQIYVILVKFGVFCVGTQDIVFGEVDR